MCPREATSGGPNDEEDVDLSGELAGDTVLSTSAKHASFEQRIMPLSGAAFNLAYWMLRNREEAEDAVQEAFLRAFRSFSAFRGDSVRPWLLQIVRNTARSALEARWRARRLVVLRDDLDPSDAREVAADAPSPEAQVLAQDDRQRLLAALATLPLIHRDVLVLREMQGLSYEEIAEATGAPIGTIMSRLSRARQMLRRVLEETVS
jgi:RNA polymerase sigma-70 factor (ECF subfamily)